MLTPRELRLGAIPELIGMGLFFIYYKCDLPYVVTSAVNAVGEARTAYTGFQEICQEAVRGSDWTGWAFLLVFVLIVFSTIMKMFITNKSMVTLFHSYSAGAMVVFAFFFTVMPFLIAAVDSEMLGRSSASFYIHSYSVAPCMLVFPFGIYFAIIAFFSYRGLLQCYDECPKQVARYAWPFFKKSWLERHYGKKTDSIAPTSLNEQQTPPLKPVIEQAVEEVDGKEQPETNSETAPYEAVQAPASSVKRKKSLYYIIGISAAVVAGVLFFFLKEGDMEDKANIPAIQEALYEGRIASAEVQVTLVENSDSVYGSYFYKKNKQPLRLSGRISGMDYVIHEFVNDKNTGTFSLLYGKYDGEMMLNGTWNNGKKTLHVYLENKVSRIIPSSDPEHPFVGEWRSAEGDSKWAYAQLGLYNKDINGGYGFLDMSISDNYYSFGIDSVLQLKGNRAVLQIRSGLELQKFTLTCNASDNSLQIETENSGSFLLFLDQRDLMQRLADMETLAASAPEVSEAQPVDETLAVVDEDATEITSDGQNQKVEIQYVPVTLDDDAEAEKARLKAELEAELHKEAATDPDKVYDKVEVMPEFPGGMTAVMRFISANLEYPKESQENGVQGKVIVQFVVGTDGSISNAHVIKGVDSQLDKEALRVINAMPRWKPGILNGESVRVKCTLPITFRLR